MVAIIHSYNMNHSAISMILKNKDKIMEHVKSAVLIMSKIRSKEVGKVMEEMKRLLSVRMQNRHQHQVPLSLMLIEEKAKSLYEDLKKTYGEESVGASF